jgi:transposase InsO family protein
MSSANANGCGDSHPRSPFRHVKERVFQDCRNATAADFFISVKYWRAALLIARMACQASFPWDEAPHYLIRDRDRIYGSVVTRRLRAMGIRDKPIAPASPWQNGFVERLIGSVRRECVDHIIVLGEAHLRRILKSYADYYKRASEHPSVYVVEEKRLC